jgi:two-component system OmpR family response regulator/two-component system response regulator QseB
VIEEVLPDMDADEVVRRVRQSGCRHPVVAIAATEQVQTRVRLLDRGADDVLAKPVHVGELAARLRALLRRSGVLAAEDPELRHGQLRMMLASRTVLDNGGVVPLTNKEFALLEALLRGKGQVLSREKLEQALHGQWKDNGSNPLEVHIHHLRRKLGGQLIRTVRRVGYTLGSEIFGSNGAAFTAGLSSCDPHTRPRA